MPPIPRPPFSKRPRPDQGAKTEAPDPAADAAVWVELEAEEVGDVFTGLFETFEECFGPEWKLEPAAAKKIGERWARLGNRWAKRVQSAIVLRAMVMCAVLFAVAQLAAMIGVRAVRTIRRKRAERGTKKTVPGQVKDATTEPDDGEEGQRAA